MMFATSRAASGFSSPYVRSETLGRFFVASTATPAESPTAEMSAIQQQQQQHHSPAADPHGCRRMTRCGSTPDRQTASQQRRQLARPASMDASRRVFFPAERPKPRLQQQTPDRRHSNQQQWRARSPTPPSSASGGFVTVDADGRVTLSEQPTQRSLPAAFFPADVVATAGGAASSATVPYSAAYASNTAQQQPSQERQANDLFEPCALPGTGQRRSSLPRSSASLDLVAVYRAAAQPSASSTAAIAVAESGARRCSSSSVDASANGTTVAAHAQSDRASAAAVRGSRPLPSASDEVALARAIDMAFRWQQQQPGSSMRYTFDAADFNGGGSGSCNNGGGSSHNGDDGDTLVVLDAQPQPQPQPEPITTALVTRADSAAVRPQSPFPSDMTVGEEWAAVGVVLDAPDRRPRRSSKIFTFQYPSKWSRTR